MMKVKFPVWSANIVAAAGIALALSACTDKAPPVPIVGNATPAPTSSVLDQDLTAMFDEARARSGVDEAYAALTERLADLCGADSAPDECMLRHMVSAYGAEEGEAACRAEMATGSATDCIVNGKLAAEVAGKLDAQGVSRQDLWRNRDLAWQQLSQLMTDAVQAKCTIGSVEAQLQCRDDFALDAFEISRFDIRDCPRSLVRDDCIMGVALATLIRRGLPSL